MPGNYNFPYINHISAEISKTVSEFNQEIPQPQTADIPVR